VIAGGLVIALMAGAVVAWPYVQRYTGSAPPPQTYDKVQLEPALARDYPRVLGVAHNAGNNLGTLSTALHYGADVMEIDVISARGQLVAGHRRPTSGYIGRTEAFDFRNSTGMKPRSAMWATAGISFASRGPLPRYPSREPVGRASLAALLPLPRFGGCRFVPRMVGS
jgi:hypothetical protein